MPQTAGLIGGDAEAKSNMLWERIQNYRAEKLANSGFYSRQKTCCGIDGTESHSLWPVSDYWERIAKSARSPRLKPLAEVIS